MSISSRNNWRYAHSRSHCERTNSFVISIDCRRIFSLSKRQSDKRWKWFCFFFVRLISLCNRIEEWTHTRVNCVAHMPSAEQDKSLIDFCAHFFFCVNVEWMIFAIQSNDAMKMSLLRTRPNSADCWCVNDYARQVKRKSFARLIRLSFMANVINWSLSSSSRSFIDAIRLTFSHTKSVSHPEISHSDSNFTLNRILCKWLSWVYVIWHSFCTVKINCNLFMNLFAHTFCKHSSMHT